MSRWLEKSIGICFSEKDCEMESNHETKTITVIRKERHCRNFMFSKNLSRKKNPL
jgi:hypothetical protein